MELNLNRAQIETVIERLGNYINTGVLYDGCLCYHLANFNRNAGNVGYAEASIAVEQAKYGCSNIPWDNETYIVRTEQGPLSGHHPRRMEFAKAMRHYLRAILARWDKEGK